MNMLFETRLRKVTRKHFAVIDKDGEILDIVKDEKAEYKRDEKPSKKANKLPAEKNLVLEILKAARQVEKAHFDDIPEFYAYAVIRDIITEYADKDEAVELIKRFVRNELTPREVYAIIEPVTEGDDEQ